MKKILSYTLVVTTLTLVLSGCSNKEEELAKMQDRNVDQMTKINQMQQSELKRLNERVQKLEKENKMLNERVIELSSTKSK